MSYTWQFVNENCSQQITSTVQSQKLVKQTCKNMSMDVLNRSWN
jgi:hypothetical protein